MSLADGTQPDANDPDIDAAEYVLGLASAGEARAIEARLASDQVLRAAVAAWQERLSPLDETAVAITPSAALWPKIERQLTQGAASSSVPFRAIGTRPAPRSPAARFRTAAIAALAASIGFIAAFVAFGLRPTEQPSAVAVLLSPDAKAGAIVQAYDKGRVIVLPIAEIPVPEGRSLQVWTLYDQARGPISLGLMEGPRSSGFYAVGTPLTRPDQLYEITLEPVGGSPIGRPTGPVLFKGNAAAVR